MLDYLYDVEAVQYSFIRVPKILLQHEDYQRIAPDAKLLYSLLLDRVGLSLRNGWKDKQNRICKPLRHHAGGGYVWGDKVIGDPNMVREGPKPSKRLFLRRVKS